MAMPDFFIAGVPKAGTTALHVALGRHPALYMSAVKEPKFFLTEGPPRAHGGPGDAKTYRERIWRRADYEALFDPASADQLRGESTPFYLHSRDAQRRIRAQIPNARLIVVLRDPVERAHSNWTHLWSAGLEPVGDLVRACAEEDRRIAAGWAVFWHYTALGRYGEQLEHLFGLVPREQVLVFRYRMLIDDPARALDRVCAFLGVPLGVLSELPRENVTAHPDPTLRHRAVATTLRAGSAVTGALPRHTGSGVIDHLGRILQHDAAPRRPLTSRERQELIPHFETDIKLLESVTGEDFGDWLGPRGDTGGLVGARPSGQEQARNGLPRSR